MNIVMIHGQDHKQTSYHLGQTFVEQLQDASLQEFFLPEDVPYFCLGCFRCMKHGLLKCPHVDAVYPIITAMKNAELLIFTTPVYCMHTSGSMKAFLDHCFVLWMTHRPAPWMFHKKAVILAVGAGKGMRMAAKDIKTSLAYWGISNIFCYYLCSMAVTYDEVEPARLAKMERDMKRLANKVLSHSNHVSLKTKTIFYMMQMMHKKNFSACTKDKAYWEEQEWLQKQRPWKSYE